MSMVSLRDRNRRAAMEHIQEVAFGLFDDRGYQQVTIAQIARAADVSESTFYRLFGAKEGLFTASPWESGGKVIENLDLDRLETELLRLVAGNQWRGMRWVMEEPQVRQAVLATLDALVGHLITLLSDHRVDRLSAAVRARHLVFGVYFSSLEQWYLDGRPGPFETYYDRAVALTRSDPLRVGE